MAEVFEGYERKYCELSANLTKKCRAASLLDGEQKKQRLSEAKVGLDEAESLIRKMDLEARSLQPNVKAVLLAKLREYKSDLNNLKSEVKRIASANLNQAARDELLESGMGDAQMVSADQREKLLMSTGKLNKTSDRVRESRRTMLETEDLGVSILSDLHQQRQALLHADNTTNLYGQASIERLKLLEKDILVRDKEIKTYRDDAGIWKTRFESSEEEAAILKTKLQRVEAAAAREREELQAEIIEEYKRSDEFAALTASGEKEEEDDDEDDDSQIRTGWKLAFKRIAEAHPEYIISDVEYPTELDVEELQVLMTPDDASSEPPPLLTDFTAEDTEIPDADAGDDDTL